jgi:hypothetical protein
MKEASTKKPGRPRKPRLVDKVVKLPDEITTIV